MSKRKGDSARDTITLTHGCTYRDNGQLQGLEVAQLAEDPVGQGFKFRGLATQTTVTVHNAELGPISR